MATVAVLCLEQCVRARPPVDECGDYIGEWPPEGPSARALVRGRTGDPAWVRPALVGLLGAAALLYIVGLSESGWANGFYSAAVQAGTKSWKAFFFGSSDASNFITVDKPPASLWVMELSARIFGVNSWSILVPQALEGVAAVGVLYATVRRWFGAGGRTARRRGARADAGRGADVPVQQPRRAARAAARRLAPTRSTRAARGRLARAGSCSPRRSSASGS